MMVRLMMHEQQLFDLLMPMEILFHDQNAFLIQNYEYQITIFSDWMV